MIPYKTPASNASVASPCVRQCCLNEQDMCVGCGRYLVEITGWLNFTDEEKMTVVLYAQQRLKQAARRVQEP
jgi:predicted Fe-S protein YdhL (DUF1289 family)